MVGVLLSVEWGTVLLHSGVSVKVVKILLPNVVDVIFFAIFCVISNLKVIVVRQVAFYDMEFPISPITLICPLNSY